MTKHDCPDCRCEEEPECADDHCLHLGGASYPGQVWFCCRCPHSKLMSLDVGVGSSSLPHPGCKLNLEVYG